MYIYIFTRTYCCSTCANGAFITELYIEIDKMHTINEAIVCTQQYYTT